MTTIWPFGDFEWKDLAALLGVLATLIGAFVIAGGWRVTNRLTQLREDRLRRIELELERSQRQISELYAPVSFLLDYMAVLEEMQARFIKQFAADDDLVHRIQKEGFAPEFIALHSRIENILLAKRHLFIEGRTPEGFAEYVRHAQSERIAWKVTKEWTEHIEIPTEPYSRQFHSDMRSGLHYVLEEHRNWLQELRATAKAERPSKKQ